MCQILRLHTPCVKPLPIVRMSSSNLTPAEVALLLGPAGPSTSFSPRQIDQMISKLTDEQLDKLLQEMGLDNLARHLPPVMGRLMCAAERVLVQESLSIGSQDTASEEDNFPQIFTAIEQVITHLEAVNLQGEGAQEVIDLEDFPTPSRSSSSSPEPPRTPARIRTVQPTPTTITVHAPTTTPVHAPTTNPTPAPTTTPAPAPTTTPAPAPTTGYSVNSPVKMGYVPSWFEAGALTDVGVFANWDDAHRSTTGHGLAIHVGFSSLAAATAALEYAREKGWTADSTPPANQSQSPLPLPSSYDDNPSIPTLPPMGNLCNMFESRAAAESAFSAAVRTRFSSRPERIEWQSNSGLLDKFTDRTVTALPLGQLLDPGPVNSARRRIVSYCLTLFSFISLPQPRNTVNLDDELPNDELALNSSSEYCAGRAASSRPVISVQMWSIPLPQQRDTLNLDHELLMMNSHQVILNSSNAEYRKHQLSQLLELTTVRRKLNQLVGMTNSLAHLMSAATCSPCSSTSTFLHPYMGTAKKKPTNQELDRRADAAWQYRQKNREATNAKAKTQMRRWREALKHASSAVQLEYAMRAAQYRHKYQQQPSPREALGKAQTPQPATHKTPKPAKQPSPREAFRKTQMQAHSRPRAPGSPTPLSLSDIAAQDDDESQARESDEE
ncbi:hypothetical protein C8R45DRAFT_934149 [Mycena sanguinolenta]|nr:hypothetical protein C8R45DRAFT_934149 [Mycena sanguinolenta]